MITQWQVLHAIKIHFKDHFYFNFFERFYLFMGGICRERQRHRQKEKQAPCREPNAEFYPGTPGSRPEPKADAQLLSHSGVPVFLFLSRLHGRYGA